MQEFLICFVPLFVAVDAIGVLPYFISLTEELEWKRKRIVIFKSVLTASIVSLIFITIGELILRLLNITLADFMIAGGTLLFIISMNDIISSTKSQRQVDQSDPGVVPIGVPLIVGPAVLATSMLLVKTHGIIITAIALILNILIAGLIFWSSKSINKFLGKAGAKAISKLASLLLASIAIMMIRKAIMSFISGKPISLG
jgi:multiple antibiotic resistance protein